MIGVFSNYLGNKVLQDYLVSKPTWLAVHTEDPTAAGDPATEMNVIRQRSYWSSPGSKSIALLQLVTFVELVSDLVSWLAVWDSSSGGHMLVPIQLATPLSVPQSGHLLIPPGDLAITL